MYESCFPASCADKKWPLLWEGWKRATKLPFFKKKKKKKAIQTKQNTWTSSLIKDELLPTEQRRESQGGVWVYQGKMFLAETPAPNTETAAGGPAYSTEKPDKEAGKQRAQSVRDEN